MYSMCMIIFYRSLEEPPGIPAFSGRHIHKQSTSVQVLTNAMAEVAKNFVLVTSAPQRPPLASDTPESPRQHHYVTYMYHMCP